MADKTKIRCKCGGFLYRLTPEKDGSTGYGSPLTKPVLECNGCGTVTPIEGAPDKGGSHDC